MSATGPNVPVCTSWVRVPLVMLNRSSEIRHWRPPSWMTGGTAKPSGMLGVGFTHPYAYSQASSPAAMTLPGWYGGRPVNCTGDVAATSNATYWPTVGSPMRGWTAPGEPFW